MAATVKLASTETARRASALLAEDYSRELTEYLACEDEAALRHAYELGRGAAGGGMRVLDLLEVHHNALSEYLRARRESPAELAPVVGAAGRFLRESLSPFEMLQMRDRDVHSALREMNKLLEEEARRVAHALHDQASSLLATVHFDLAELAESMAGCESEPIGRMQLHLAELRAQLRRLSHEICPPMLEVCGLGPAVEFLASGVAKRTGMAIAVEDRAGTILTETFRTTVYRVVQEALNNIVRHARATRVDIRLAEVEGRFECTVRDNGCGFDAGPYDASTRGRGLGLIGMEDRLRALAGVLEIESGPGRGTLIRISLPIDEGDAQ